MTTAGQTELHLKRRERVLQALADVGREGLPTPALARKCGLSASQARRQLLRLEQDGLVWSTMNVSKYSDTGRIQRIWSLKPLPGQHHSERADG